MSRKYDLMITVNTARRPILLIGGGAVGERKARTLLDAGADVILVSPDLTEELERMVRQGLISWRSRKACPEDFEGAGLAVLAVPPQQTRELVEWARVSRTLCNCCSLPEAGDWALAAQFREEGLVFGVSTGGDAPSLAVRWKRKLMGMIKEAAE